MEGKIVHINNHNGLFAVETEQGFSIIEMLSDTNFHINDEVSWVENETLGHDMITNNMHDETVEVYFQNHYVNSENLSKQLGYK